jgi:1-acyl-sn-glycerol-3-phosphate acyltransferase
VQRLLLALARRAVRVHYRVSYLGGSVPADGPVLLVGNHPNGLVDPVLVASTTPRTVRFLGKAPLFEMPLLGHVMRGLEALPVYRAQDGADTSANARTFEAVFAALARGELVCLFPEGKSHDAPALAELKTGAARMALGAEARQGGKLGVSIVPVGLVYRSKRRFRSRVAVWTGAPLAVQDLLELHRRDERAAVHALTERIAAGLGAVTLELEQWEDLPLLELAERILFDQREGRIERVRAFALRLRELRALDPARIDELGERIGAFGERLGRLGLSAKDLPEKLTLEYTPLAVARFLVSAALRLGLALPLAALGALVWFLPYRLIGTLAARFATSDTLATARILGGFVLFPLWLALLAGLAGWRFGVGPALALALGAALLGPVALAFRDWQRWARGEVRTFLRVASRRRLRELLVRERAALADELARLRAPA